MHRAWCRAISHFDRTPQGQTQQGRTVLSSSSLVGASLCQLLRLAIVQVMASSNANRATQSKKKEGRAMCRTRTQTSLQKLIKASLKARVRILSIEVTLSSKEILYLQGPLHGQMVQARYRFNLSLDSTIKGRQTSLGIHNSQVMILSLSNSFIWHKNLSRLIRGLFDPLGRTSKRLLLHICSHLAPLAIS